MESAEDSKRVGSVPNLWRMQTIRKELEESNLWRVQKIRNDLASVESE